MNVRWAIGPANYAGQAHRWARAAAERLGVEAWSFAGMPLRGGGYGFDVDRTIGRVPFRLGTAWGWRAKRLFRGTTHIALDGFQSFSRWDRHTAFPADARRLERFGFRMSLVSHGSDVRDPGAHIARDDWSYFAVGDDGWRRLRTEQTARNRQFAEDCGWPVFYSTPDLGADLPFGTWLPVVVDVDVWASEAPLLEHEKPRVLHIPSQRNPPIKGTHLIMPVLERLEREGAIEVVAPSGLPHTELRRLVQECDVVIDQLLFGSYGVAAVEAMAAGRITIGRLNADVGSRMVETPELLEATPESLYEIVTSVRDRRDELRAQAARGVAFVRRWHNGEEAARRLADYLLGQ